MRWSSMAVGAVVALFCAAVAVQADDTTRLSGKISKAEKDGTFELAAKGGPFQVSIAETTVVAVHAATTLDQVAAGVTIYALAVKQAEQFDPKSQQRIPECITQIQTIVAGEEFEPPAKDKSSNDRHEWLSGKLMKNGRGYGLGSVQMNVGKDHVVLQLEKGDKAALGKGKLVIVEGSHTGDLKAKQFAATRVHVLSTQIGAGDYHAAFGL